MDFNTYWMIKEEDYDNLRYVVNNFNTKKFSVTEAGNDGGRKHVFSKNLESISMDFEKKEKGYLFKFSDGEEFYFKGIKQKGFDIRYDFGDLSKMVTIDYNNKEYLEISFFGNIKVEATDKERAPGLPFYRIKKE